MKNPANILKDRSSHSNPAPGQERRRTQGHVIDCNGTHAIISAEIDPNCEYKENYWAVGQLLSIWQGRNRIVGLSYKVESTTDEWLENNEHLIRVHVELVGEIQESEDGSLKFTTGISDYPRIGAISHRIRASDLEAIYKNESADAVQIGQLTQDVNIPAKIDLDRLLSRHFAVVGSTGVGKSTAVSLILRKVIAHRNDIRVMILDPHDEFTAAFGDVASVKTATTLQLPFWLFRFAEFTEVVLRGQRGLNDESELLRDLIAEAKERYAQGAEETGRLVRKRYGRNGYTADSPVPYRMADLMRVIEERQGALEGKREKPLLSSLKARLQSITQDPRFDFMFSLTNTGGDRMSEILADLFRVPMGEKPISIIDMSALPAEVINSVTSVLCRLAFDLAVSSNGAVQTLMVCEEAHRYVPADENAGFWPARQAIARIAKEGRKYGVYLGVITQRPSELDPTILSQCNTIFAMRLSNQTDKGIIGGALTHGAQSTIGFLSSIANREAIAFGEGLKTPMRMTFEKIADEMLPGSHIHDVQQKVRDGMTVEVDAIVRRMRGEGETQPDDSPETITDLGEVRDEAQREANSKSDLNQVQSGVKTGLTRGQNDLNRFFQNEDFDREPVRTRTSTINVVSAFRARQ